MVQLDTETVTSERLAVAGTVHAQDRLYSAVNANSVGGAVELRELNPADGSTLNVIPITLSGQPAFNTHGLAFSPITKTLWAILNLEQTGPAQVGPPPVHGRYAEQALEQWRAGFPEGHRTVVVGRTPARTP